MRPVPLMRRLLPFVLALLAVPALADDLPVVTFLAPMEHIREARALLKDGFATDDQVEVSERAVVFTPPLVLPDLRTAGAQAYDEVTFVVAYLRTNFAGTAEQMVEYWVPDERAARMKDMRDPDKQKAVRAFFGKFPGITVVAMVQQPTTTTVYISRGKAVQGIHVRRTAERLYLTAKPDNDLSLAIIEGALMAGSYR